MNDIDAFEFHEAFSVSHLEDVYAELQSQKQHPCLWEKKVGGMACDEQRQ